MKKILFVTHYEGIGGANLSMLFLIENLRKYEDVEPYVILPGNGPIENELQNHNIPYEVHKYLSWRANGKFNILKILIRCVAMFIFNTIAAYKIHRNNKDIDILYANSSKVVLPIFLRCFYHKTIIWHLREFGSIDYEMSFVVPLFVVKRWLSSADAIIAISKEIQNFYQNKYCAKGKYHLVYNGIEENDYKSISKRFQDSILSICIVGGVDSSKNQEDLIKAVDILNQKQIPVRLDIIGQDKTEYGSSLKAYVKDHKLANVVNFCGQINGVNNILSSYDVGVITSKYEAFGRVVVEYMFSNIVVVASNAGACPELIINNETGFLYKLGNYQELAKNLEDIYNNPQIGSSIADAGNKYAHEHFTARINAHNIKIIIDTL